jgi:general secretion pathway protein F
MAVAVATQYYRYQACDAQGAVHRGRISADSEQEAVALLQARQLVPVQLQAVEEGEDAPLLLRRRGISHADIIDFTEGLTTLVEARVPLDRALQLLEGTMEKPAMKLLVSNLRREVKEGKSLAEALQGHTPLFSNMYINMVLAGEEGGILDKLLPRLANFLKDAHEARRTVISALIYPAVLLFVGFISIVLLLVFVVPKFAVLFEDMGSAMPESAALLLGVSGWLREFGWTLLLLPPGVWLVWRHMGATPERRLQRDTFLLRLPLLGSLLLQAESSRFCRTLGALLHSGIPLLKALHIVSGVLDNRLLQQTVAQVEEAVRGGISLGRALGQTEQFPVLLAQLVVVGEESGRTAMILDKLAESFDAHVKQQTGRLVALVEPLLIVILGLVVGTVVIVMLSAVFSINELQY